jgi:hypothetical protein
VAGSSARRARRLTARNQSSVAGRTVADSGDADKTAAAGEGREATPGKPTARRPLNRTAARRPGAARPDAVALKVAAGSDAPTPAVDAPTTRPAGDKAPLVVRLAASIDQRGDSHRKTTSTVRMQDNEVTVGYVAAAILIVVPVIFLTVTTGKGAVAHPPTVAPAIGVVLALAMAATLRLRNRIVTASLAFTSTVSTTSVGNAVPSAVRPLSTLDLAVLAFAMWITLRQSKARSAALAERRKANQAARGTTGAGGRGGRQPAGPRAAGRPAGGRKGRKAAEAEPAGPPPSPRYTPPKKRS